MIQFRVDGLFGPTSIVNAISSNTNTTAGSTTSGGDSVTTYTPHPYTCQLDPAGHMFCVGKDLVDLQFHNLQDLINQTNVALQQKSTAYKYDSISVDGVINQATVDALNALANTASISGMAPTYTAPGIAADVSSIISMLNAYVTSNYSAPVSTVTTDPVTYTSIPPTSPTVYICPNGEQVSDPNLCAAYSPPAQNSSPDPVIISVPGSGSSTSPTVNIVNPTNSPDQTRLFGFPRAWVLGGAVAGGIGISAILIALLTRRR